MNCPPHPAAGIFKMVLIAGGARKPSSACTARWPQYARDDKWGSRLAWPTGEPMRCLKCGSDIPAGKKFCGDCGTPLANHCPQCGADNPPGKRFCGDCGTALVATIASAQPTSALDSGDILISGEETASEGERKTVTALFADIKGSMELMESLDPEEARAIVDPALNLMIDAVRRYDGYIVQSTGDGVFALFGAPVAHEDHPQRALYAALRIQEDIRRYGEGMRAKGQAPLQVRIGINTGEVVVRSLKTGSGQAEYTPIGHSTSLAARLETLATPGAIVISDSTRRFVEGYFQLKDLGRTAVKGVSEPVELFEVTGLGPLRTRLQVAARRGLTRFIGRDTEMAQMCHAFDLTRQGHGQIVAAMGETGVGKSRLLYEFKAVSEPGCLVLEAYSVSHGKASAYLPVIELLREYFHIAADDDERGRREKIAGRVLMLERSLEDTLPYIFTLMGFQEGSDLFAQMDPQVRRRRTQEAIKRILLRESLNQPLVVVFEDLHWIDSETQAFLNYMVDAIANARILLLVNYRPEYRHDWGSRTYYTQLRLDPLGRESASEMLSALLGDEPELEPLRRLIAERSEGNPFFIEEIIQALFEQGALARNGSIKLTRPLANIKVPATIQAVLASRIDRLPPNEKELLQTIAVIGREFPLQLIREVTGKPQPDLDRALRVLQSGEFVYEQPAFPEPEYVFKHALTQEVAYNSVLIERRKLLHNRAGAAIESLYASRLDDHLEELVRHYSRSDNATKAVEYLRLASAQALKRSHHTEAIAHARAALELLPKIPSASDRADAEFTLQSTLAMALMPVLGFAAPEVGVAWERAAVLARQNRPAQLTFVVVGGLCAFYTQRADHRRANQLANEMLEIAATEKNEALLMEGHFALGGSLFWLGRFAESLKHVRLGSVVRSGSSPVNYHGADTPAFALAYQASCFWQLGFPDQAMKMCSQALARVDSLSHPFAAASARLNVVEALLHVSAELGLQQAERIVAISAEHGFRHLETIGKTFRIMAILDRRADSKLLTELAALIRGQAEFGARLAFPMKCMALAKGYGEIGEPEQGLTLVDEALNFIEETSEYQMNAELHRLKGQLLLLQTQSNFHEAERWFRTAIDIARVQQAKSLELRAATSLSRLLASQHRRDEARTMLAEIYNWFTEGFDTADLKNAKALLDELSD
jgi:class 3 adenylate cyclase/tetratricopeptide (TPR) repeat protein